MIYKGCKITAYQGGFVWEEIHYGAESDDMFASVAEAKADIDRFYSDGPAPVEIDSEISVEIIEARLYADREWFRGSR